MEIPGTTPFDRYVRLKYQVYNGLFLNLPFDLIRRTGTLLPLLSTLCEKKYAEGAGPHEIIAQFFSDFLPDIDAREQLDVLFHFIQYIERQVVLFDAIEEAAFDKTHDMSGPGTIEYMFDRLGDGHAIDKLSDKLHDYNLRIVLTAHPTQFYPGPVLGIITDLAHAIRTNDLMMVNDSLHQLGQTPFINREKPSPLDEAKSLVWYLENVFYGVISEVVDKLRTELHTYGIRLPRHDLIRMGFWPGGDRDGNPNVTADITLATAARLRRAILTCYHNDARALRRRLTFREAHDRIVRIEYRLFDGITGGDNAYRQVSELRDDLIALRDTVNTRYHGLFAEDVTSLIARVETFGFFFASMDIRQDSRKHAELIDTLITHKTGEAALDNYRDLTTEQKAAWLMQQDWKIAPDDVEDAVSSDIIASILAMTEIQRTNGPQACHRYVISNTRHMPDVIALLAVIRWACGTSEHVDIVPLFETIDDLAQADSVMDALYRDPHYAAHLARRNNEQTVMLGFSDGTKDGGYLQANWSIFTAKESLTAVARQHGVRVLFFDGRGGPPSRGGGNTHKFYASLGSTVETKEVQLTIQGQTISSNFGTHDAALFNIEQLFTAGLEADVFSARPAMTDAQRTLMSEMAKTGYEAYSSIKSRPEFFTYLRDAGTLDYYSETRIASRPVSRGKPAEMTLDTLRAIPFAGSWSQLKQNVPGYFGFGSALRKQRDAGSLDAVKELYLRCKFFQTLVGNSMQSLSKTFFPLTASLGDDAQYGDFWHLLHDEYRLSRDMLLEISGAGELLEDQPNIRQSIRMREAMMLPLLTIQHDALHRIRSGTLSEEEEQRYRKVVVRTMYGIINASRNSA